MVRNSFLLLIAVILFSSCGKFRKIQKSEDWRVKYDAALDYFDKKDYYKASVLLEEILPLLRGELEGEKAQFYYAYCNYYQKNYQLSSYYFKTFYQTYSRSQYASEAEFMHAYSLYLDSPVFDLDQASTTEAIDAMQLFLNRNVGSEYSQQASDIIVELQRKLEKKAYENAYQYYKLRTYKSAIIAFDNFSIDYPDSEYNEILKYLKVEAQYRVAIQSIRSKQAERYQKVLEFYEEFTEDYPESDYIQDLGPIFDESISSLGKLKQIQDKSGNFEP